MNYLERNRKNTERLDNTYYREKSTMSKTSDIEEKNNRLYKSKTETNLNEDHPKKETNNQFIESLNNPKQNQPIQNPENILGKIITSSTITPLNSPKEGPQIEIASIGVENKTLHLVTDQANKQNVIKLTSDIVDLINKVRPEKDQLSIEDYSEKTEEIYKRNVNTDGTINTQEYQKEALAFLGDLFLNQTKEDLVLTEDFIQYKKETLTNEIKPNIETKQNQTQEIEPNENLKATNNLTQESETDILTIDGKSKDLVRNTANLDIISQSKIILVDDEGNVVDGYAKKTGRLDEVSEVKTLLVTKDGLVAEFSKNPTENNELSPQDSTKNEIDLKTLQNKNHKTNEQIIVNEKDRKTNISISNDTKGKQYFENMLADKVVQQQNSLTPSVKLGKLALPNFASGIPGMPGYLSGPIPLNERDPSFGFTAISSMIMMYNLIPLVAGDTLKTLQNMASNPTGLVTQMLQNPTSALTLGGKITDFNMTLSPLEIAKLAMITPKLVPLLKGINIKTPNFPRVDPGGTGPFGAPILRFDDNIDSNFKWYKNRVLEQRNKFAEAPEGGTGFIVVESPIKRAKIYKIPFQFTPKIGAQRIETNYANQKILNRIGEIYTFTGVGNMSLSVETEFLALSGPQGLTSENVYLKKFDLSKLKNAIKKITNFVNGRIQVSQGGAGVEIAGKIADSVLQGQMQFQKYWNQDLVDTIMTDLRALQMPSYASQYFSPPPIISIDFGPDSNILKKPVFNELSETQIYSSRLKTFIVKSVSIDQDLQGKFPLKMFSNTSLIFNSIERKLGTGNIMNFIYENGREDLIQGIENAMSGLNRSLILTGFTASLELIEIEVNIHDIPPSFEEWWGFANSYADAGERYSTNSEIWNMTQRNDPTAEAESYRLTTFVNKPKEASVMRKLKLGKDKTIKGNIASLQADLTIIRARIDGIENMIVEISAKLMSPYIIMTAKCDEMYLSTKTFVETGIKSGDLDETDQKYYNDKTDSYHWHSYSFLNSVRSVSDYQKLKFKDLDFMLNTFMNIRNYTPSSGSLAHSLFASNINVGIEKVLQIQYNLINTSSADIDVLVAKLPDLQRQLRDKTAELNTFETFDATPATKPNMWPYR